IDCLSRLERGAGSRKATELMTEQKQQSQQQQKDESGKINCAIHSAAAGQWYLKRLDH
ncbi:MAG: hypothetical protein QOH31_2264, partial [Verrucomicrobiota bacterium]